MTRIVLFHHVLGLTPGVEALATALREAGHEVTTPDLFEGRTFDDLAAGLSFVGEIGDDALLARAEQACADLPSDIVLAGLSLGAVPAQHLLQTRPGAAGCLLLHSFVDPAQLQGTWPNNVQVDVFAMDHDPFFVGDGDLEAAQRWQREHPNLRIHLYPGAGHLFTEPSSPDHDAAATRSVIGDVRAALAAYPGR
ncbi:dienelactone hydrolase family protein [Brachybacterium sp. ACRRE]|uniref:dienelactone hydrolase family protein n=1 Tax=Brachybacterium sp. ACRRE TaxID=2918184 RepID=UPI001EF35001|nr:dienelactone hydrolase family protein [Brachybacterium sp. ACRRE]MCG7310319.1 dienelactone hydrolase family protein [Brachybacterium sp. ACRRE]